MRRAKDNSFKSCWSGPTARILESVYRCKSPATFFVSKARELFKQVRPVGPPFDPHEYAKALKIKVREEDMTLDGFLKCNNLREFEISLNRNTRLSRKNFTLAHEIAHTFVFFDLHEFSAKFRRGETYDKGEERLCDLAAAELLMPFSVFKGDLLRLSVHGTITPETVFTLMDRYNVSLQATCTRIAWVESDSVCALWKKEGTSISPEWVAPFRLKRMALCRTGRSSIEQALKGKRDVITETDTFYVMGKRKVHKTSSLLLRSGAVLSVLQARASVTEHVRAGSSYQPQHCERQSISSVRAGCAAEGAPFQFSFSFEKTKSGKCRYRAALGSYGL